MSTKRNTGTNLFLHLLPLVGACFAKNGEAISLIVRFHDDENVQTWRSNTTELELIASPEWVPITTSGVQRNLGGEKMFLKNLKTGHFGGRSYQGPGFANAFPREPVESEKAIQSRYRWYFGIIDINSIDSVIDINNQQYQLYQNGILEMVEKAGKL